MIFEKLKKEFSNNMTLAWESDFDVEKIKYKIEVEKHVEMWNKMAEFMGYGVLIAPNLSRFIPIYFNRRFPSGNTYVNTEEGLFTNVEDYNPFEDYIKTEYIKEFGIDEWSPTIDFNHAKECEALLLKKGKYNSINIKNYLGEMSTRIKYSGSTNNNPIFGEGKNELEAICDACVKFMNLEKGIQLELFDSEINNGPVLSITH
jgi:hypothetical protein